MLLCRKGRVVPGRAHSGRHERRVGDGPARRSSAGGRGFMRLRLALHFLAFVLVLNLLSGCGGRGMHTVTEVRPCPPGDVVCTARSQIGRPYRFGGLSPDSGFDCSGFTWWVYHQHGINLPRQSFDQSTVGRKILAEELKQGDLVFFEERQKGASHVGIYSGQDRFIHCPSSGGGVREERFSDRHWRHHYLGACRILPY
jgi:murein DD-endopeptidase